MSQFLLMCWEYFKTGLFAMGGGLATVPFLREISERHPGWYSIKDLTTMIAVSESTPGPMGVNMATYVGNHLYGVIGGIACTLSLVAPSVIVIFIIARMLEKFKGSKIVKAIFAGLRPAVVGFILAAVVDIYLSSLFNIPLYRQNHAILSLFHWTAIVLFAALLTVYKKFPRLHPIFVILIGAAAGIVLKL